MSSRRDGVFKKAECSRALWSGDEETVSSGMTKIPNEAISCHDIWLYQFLKAGCFYTTDDGWKELAGDDSLTHDFFEEGTAAVWKDSEMDDDVFSCWLGNGGEETIRSFKGLSSDEREKILASLDRMPYCIETERFIIRHTFCSPKEDFFPGGDYSIGKGNLLDSGRIRKDYDEDFWDREIIRYSNPIKGRRAY